MNPSAAAQIQAREPQGRRTPSPAGSRHHALVRLYERRAAVDQLISALERYQRDMGQRPEPVRVEGLSAAGMSL